MKLLLEVIVQTVAAAREAAKGGADRLEVVRAIRDGGLTPARGARDVPPRVRSVSRSTRALDELTGVGQVDRILTSGGPGDLAQRCERLRACTIRVGNRFTVIAGGGVTDKALSLLARTGCVQEVHIGRAAREGADPEGPVSAARVCAVG